MPTVPELPFPNQERDGLGNGRERSSVMSCACAVGMAIEYVDSVDLDDGSPGVPGFADDEIVWSCVARLQIAQAASPRATRQARTRRSWPAQSSPWLR
jgi:hypothetical protein